MGRGPRLAVLGPVLIEGPDGALTTVPGALARAFLVALVLARGRTLTTASLIDVLWEDDQPRGARAALQTLVSRLRRSSADGLIVSTDTGYRLDLGDDDVDLVAAESAALVARAALDDGRPRDAVELVEPLVASWRGEPGGDLSGELAESLADRAALALRALRRVLAEALAGCDDPEAAVRLWEDETAAQPFDEAAVAGLMRALDAAGRTSEAIAVFAAHRERLADELGADPSAELVRFNQALLRRSASASPDRARRVGLRAAPTALVGRDAAVAEVRTLLAEHRLVTILGAGGLGKTRLAQAVAAGVDPGTAVVVVELAPIGDGADVVPALGALLGVAETRAGRTSLRPTTPGDLRARVVGILGEQPTVLVLDNCEHIVADAAALAGELLAELPDLRVLTTSRAPLAIAGEVVSPLAPLPVAAGGAAVRLFTDRARAARPGAVLPLDTVGRICTRLDGSPLAIELAAARIRGMSIDEIERRLDDRFALLRGGDRSAPERHRTLLAVIEWSWRLLDAGAQDLLTRLSLFPDGTDVEAVEAVADPDRAGTVFDDLAELVEQSLVQLTEREGQPARYRLLETVREFGAAQLAERGATADVRSAMEAWGAAFAGARSLFGARTDQVRAFREMERESDNLVALLRWTLRDAEAARHGYEAATPGTRSVVARLFAALGSYWAVRGAHAEASAVAADVVGVLTRRAVQPGPGDPARVPTAVALATCAAAAGFDDHRLLARALSSIRRMRAQGPIGDPLLELLLELLMVLGRPGAMESVLARHREAADPRVAAFALTVSAPLTENDGDVAAALEYTRRAVALADDVEDAWTRSTATIVRTQLLAQTGDPAETLVSAARARTLLEPFGADSDLDDLGWVVGLASAATGDVDRARTIGAELAARDVSSREDDERAEFTVLARSVRAEAARAGGDLDDAIAQYDVALHDATTLPGRGPQWHLLIGAARIAIGAEARAAGRGPDDGRTPGLQADHADHPDPADNPDRAVARRLRIAVLVALRMAIWWLDLPVVGAAILGVLVWAADARTVPPELIARGWGIAMRFGARQDLGVLRHDRLRTVLGAVTGDQALADATTASAGLSRAEAVGAARALLEERAFRGDAPEGF